MADKRAQRRNISRLAGGVFGVLLLAAFVWFVHAMMNGKVSKSKRQVQMVQIIRPPPPPPPDQPPPPPPPPEKNPEPLPKDEPEPKPEEQQQAPPEAPLGLDAEGAAGGDAFGLAARRGGSDLVGGTGTAPFAWYQGRISDAVREHLSNTPCAKNTKGSLSIHLFVESDGRFKQAQLASSTGNRQTDQCIETALSSLPRLSDPPPPGMPEQVTVRIVARI